MIWLIGVYIIIGIIYDVITIDITRRDPRLLAIILFPLYMVWDIIFAIYYKI